MVRTSVSASTLASISSIVSWDVLETISARVQILRSRQLLGECRRQQRFTQTAEGKKELMPKKVHSALVSAAKAKGLKGKAKDRYVYGTLRRIEKKK
jgi:hypothetical protein